MSEYSEKIAKAKQSIAAKDSEVRVGFFGDNDIKKIHESLAEVHAQVDEVLQKNKIEAIENNAEKFDELKTEIQALQNELKSGIEITNLSSIIQRIASLKFEPIVNVPTPIANVENKILVQDWRKEYMFSDSDKTRSVTYVGFVTPTGSWYIERVTKSESSDKARFVFGKSDYVSNWGKRLQLDYKYLFEAYNGRT